MKPSEVYEEAAQLVQQYGIAKVSFGNCRDGFCALGAVRQAVSPNNRIMAMESPVARDAEHVLAQVLKQTGRIPENWNGSPNQEHMDFATVIQEEVEGDSRASLIVHNDDDEQFYRDLAESLIARGWVVDYPDEASA